MMPMPLGILQGAAHQFGILHRLAVVGDRHAAGLLQLTHLGHALAVHALGDGADREDVAEAFGSWPC